MTDYNKLKIEFDNKVLALQKVCKHTKKQWMEQYWAIGNSSGYEVLICLNCDKRLKENPTKEERDKATLKLHKELKKDFKKRNKI